MRYDYYGLLEAVEDVGLCVVNMGEERMQGVFRILAYIGEYFKEKRVVTDSFCEQVYALCRRYDTEYDVILPTNSVGDLYNYVHDVSKSEWLLYVADDELPSPNVISDIQKIIESAEDCPVVKFNYVGMYDWRRVSSDFYAEKLFRREGYKSPFLGQTHLYHKSLHSYYADADYYYYHYKTPADVLWGTVWASLINPDGHESMHMGVIRDKLGISTFVDIREALEKPLPEDVEQYMIKYANKDTCVLYFVFLYFFVLHNERRELAIRYKGKFLEFLGGFYNA